MVKLQWRIKEFVWTDRFLPSKKWNSKGEVGCGRSKPVYTQTVTRNGDMFLNLMFLKFIIASNLKMFTELLNQQRYVKCTEDINSKWEVRTG